MRKTCFFGLNLFDPCFFLVFEVLHNCKSFWLLKYYLHRSKVHLSPPLKSKVHLSPPPIFFQFHVHISSFSLSYGHTCIAYCTGLYMNTYNAIRGLTIWLWRGCLIFLEINILATNDLRINRSQRKKYITWHSQRFKQAIFKDNKWSVLNFDENKYSDST